MAYMRRNVNLLLMLLVLVVLFSLVLLTTFYQKNYRNLTETYEVTSKELSKVSQNFTSKLDELQRTTSELKIKSTDKEKLDGLYTQLTSEKNKLETELKATQDSLAAKAVMLEQTESELSRAKVTLIKQAEEMAELELGIRNRKQKIDELNAEICILKKQVDPAYVC